ncbi:hypothetical protein RUR49_24220 [Pseudoxanthobacter sp. M-2]
MLPLFVDAVPSFLRSWQAFVSDWQAEPELPLYLALGDLACHLIDQLSRGDITHFPAVFGLVERCHAHGDPYVQEAVTIGLLEDLQNPNLHVTTAPSDFEVWLAPRSKAAWDSLHRFWAGEAPYVRGV